MISGEYPGDYVTEALPDGSAIAFDDEESDENESPDTSVGYGSLLSLGAGIRKKQPLIVVDPLEAENEARRVQFLAARQLVDPEEAGGIDFLNELAYFAQLEVPDADAPDPELSQAESYFSADDVGEDVADDEADFDHATGDDDSDPEEHHVDETVAEAAVPSDTLEDRFETPERDEVNEAGGIGPVAPPAPLEPSNWQPATAQPAAPRHGHSLRAVVPAPQVRMTFAERVAAFASWLYEWLTRDRG